MSEENEGHIYANSEPLAHPVYENVSVNGKADNDDTYENVMKETGNDQEISVTLKTEESSPLYDTLPSLKKEIDNNNDEDDIVVVSDTMDEMVVHDIEKESKPAEEAASVTEEDNAIEAEVEIEIPQTQEEEQPKSPSHSRSNSASPTERPASPTPASDEEPHEPNVCHSPSPSMSDEETANIAATSEDNDNDTRRDSMHSPVPTPTPRKRTSLCHGKSPEFDINKEACRSPSPKEPSISSEGRNTRSPSPDDMIIHQEEEIIKNGETQSMSNTNATFTALKRHILFNINVESVMNEGDIYLRRLMPSSHDESRTGCHMQPVIGRITSLNLMAAIISISGLRLSTVIAPLSPITLAKYTSRVELKIIFQHNTCCFVVLLYAEPDRTGCLSYGACKNSAKVFQTLTSSTSLPGLLLNLHRRKQTSPGAVLYYI
uniref:Uncharacterized protein n=1 Tax=Octopus bimaculoides TaxID=37653 RepID=A0A0L8FVI9_OCTBM